MFKHGNFDAGMFRPDSVTGNAEAAPSRELPHYETSLDGASIATKSVDPIHNGRSSNVRHLTIQPISPHHSPSVM